MALCIGDKSMMPQALTGLAGELGFKRRDKPREYGKAWRVLHTQDINEYHRNYYHTKTKKSPQQYKKNLESGKWSRRKKKYGITKAQYDALLAEQNGNCYICGVHEEYNLRVDHDHSTGKVRGLLCSACNVALGGFKDDPVRLRAAANYIEQHQGKGF